MVDSTPKKQGYFMPAEWTAHEATWLSWPKNPLTFPSDIIDAVEKIYCQMVGALQDGEAVKILVDNSQEEQRVRSILHANGVACRNLVFYNIKSADVWMRDYGLTFLLKRKNLSENENGAGKTVGTAGAKAAVKWIFNAWGEKYDDLLPDNAAGEQIAKLQEAAGLQVFRPNIVMEGGSIEVNGQGTVLVTEQCLLNKNRNPKLGRTQIEGHLKNNLGVDEVIWLKDGIAGDDTDGHVDDFARFVGKETVVCAYEENKADANRKPLAAAYSSLCKRFETIKLPMPAAIIDPVENRRLPASYANFYMANGIVLLPVFGDRKDKAAQETLQTCFPKHEVVPIQAKELVYGYGGIHCVTQQEPKV